jgi:hypothetical protein
MVRLRARGPSNQGSILAKDRYLSLVYSVQTDSEIQGFFPGALS